MYRLYLNRQGSVFLKALILTSALILFSNTNILAQAFKPLKPSSKDKCPVCGMFVAKYSDWIAQIIFKDQSYAVFDGVKDMMKYYHALHKYSPGKRLSDIADMYVTDYYTLTAIDAHKAYYVIGSDVLGPMGKDLIPFVSEADAKEFVKDHKGKKILRFNQITIEIIKSLD